VIDMDEKGARSALRLSPHYYNTPEEIDAAIATLAELLS
jgi:selenocysteine lyase/cysteine desulfurase